MGIISPPVNFYRDAPRSWHQRRRQAMVSDLCHGLSGSALDYGCGWGDLTALVAHNFDSIIGVDADPERVAFAGKERAPIVFRECSVTGTPFEDRQFDVVLSIVVLPFVPDPLKYIEECKRLLRTGGTLVVAIPNPESFWRLLSRLKTGLANKARPSGTTIREFEQVLSEKGFHVLQREGFFDPPFDRLKNIGDVLIAALNTVGYLLRMKRRYSYIGFRCQLTRQQQ